MARKDKTDEIIFEEDYIHDYKLVRFANGEFGYILKYRNELLLYRFDLVHILMNMGEHWLQRMVL